LTQEDHLINSQQNIEEDNNFLNDLDFEKILNVLKKNLLTMIIIIAITVSASFLYLRYTPPIYQSESILKLNLKKEARVLGLIGTDNDQDINQLSGEIELLRSPLLLKRVIENSNLRVSYFTYGQIMDSERYQNSPFRIDIRQISQSLYDRVFDLNILDENKFEIKYLSNGNEVKKTFNFGTEIKVENLNFFVNKTDDFNKTQDSKSFYFIVNSDQALIRYLSQNLTAEIVNMYANTLKVSFKDHNRQKAKDVVSTVDSLYLKLTLEEKNKANSQKIDFLDTLLAETEKKLEHFEDYFESFIIENKTNDIPADIEKTVASIDQLKVQKKVLNDQIQFLNQLSKEVLDEKDTTLNLPIGVVLNDAHLIDLINQYNSQVLKAERIKFSYTQKTTASQKSYFELDLIISNLLERVDKNKEFIYQQMRELSDKISQLEGTFLSLPSKGTAYTKNQRQYKVHESYYMNMMYKKAELGIEEAGTIPEFQVLSSASIPGAPISPDKLIVYGIGLGLGLFLSIGLVVVRYLMHNTINTVRDLEKLTSAPVLGSVPYFSSEKMVVSRLIVDRNPKSAISESLRSIRTNMEFMVPGKKKKIISITSTISGEGKTFVAVNLAGVIALSQSKVILLDLDMRRPKVNLAFGHENLEGMSTILIGKHKVFDCIRKTPLKNLDYISAGPTPPNPSELIMSTEFDEVISQLHQVYDIIIFDTPPVGLVTDGVLVMQKADLPIYIVRSDYSKRDFMKTLKRLLRENKFTKTSIILNSVKYSKKYNYSYGYVTGYYEENAEAKVRFPYIKELLNGKR
jgi:tyrosine-protein kinase Etk/Wzc